MSGDVGRVLNRLCKWRTILTGWQLGTRSSEDPEAQAVRDQRELLLLLRTEVNAITKALFDAGILNRRNFDKYLTEEAEALMASLEERWPGAKATDAGMSLDAAKVKEWMGKFPQ